MKRATRIVPIVGFVIATIVVAVDAARMEVASGNSEIDGVHAANQAFAAAISNRDIAAIDELWAHESYATFVGPLSTTLVVGWDGVRKAWQMRFGQFERVAVSVTESRVHVNGSVAWSVGVENVRLLRKNGETLAFDAFTTNVFEKRGDRWLLVSHQATPMFAASP